MLFSHACVQRSASFSLLLGLLCAACGEDAAPAEINGDVTDLAGEASEVSEVGGDDAPVDLEDETSEASGGELSDSDDGASELSDSEDGEASEDAADEASDGGGDSELGDATSNRPRKNVLVIIADDVSAREFGAYGASPSPTPTLDALAASSRKFTAAWSNPVCSPTRAGIYTGRHAFRHGVGAVAPPGGRVSRPGVLFGEELTLAEVLGNAGYRTALVGKWHLGTNEDQGGLCAPLQIGHFGHYAGSSDAVFSTYATWTRTEGNGLECDSAVVTTYPTTDVVDSALRFIGTETSDQPWLVVAAFNAPHAPFHAPPAALSGDPELTDADCVGPGRRQCFLAALRALDAEVGRLLVALPDPDNTVVIVLGDNGDPSQVVTAPYTMANSKDTLYEGGILVPLFVYDHDRPAATIGEPVQTLDIFATVVELAAAWEYVPETTIIDSRSLLSDARADYVLSEQFAGGDPSSGDYAIRRANHKLLVRADGTREYYDLATDEFEQANRIADESVAGIVAELEAAALALR